MTVRMNPYLVTNGNGREAVAFYQKALGAQVLGVQTFGEMPSSPDHPLPEGAKDLIMHALLQVGDSQLMLSDNYPGMAYQTGNNLTIALHTNDATQAKQFYDALVEGGKATMPLQQTPWSPAYGQLTDKFGVLWQINTDHSA